MGLPLALAFGRHYQTIGYDVDKHKLAHYSRGTDPSNEVSADEFAAAINLELSADPESLRRAEVIIVVVPTPIDKSRRPDLGPLVAACETVGKQLAPGATVVFESTVYPGCTEEVCVPILERESGLSWLGRGGDEKAGFYVGYSPERINPGDREHTLENVTKVVAGDTARTGEKLGLMYGSVVKTGVFQASSIKVAEAAKVIENTQRDLNIALMNELALIFERMEIDTLDVLEAAGTKWNFMPFRPGLVGGHCIGVDPYYLTYKAESMGHHPQVILAGRKTNDGMGKFVAEQTVKQLVHLGHPINGCKVGILGLTFKENCADIRNSGVADIVAELADYRCEVSVHDPLANAGEAMQEYGIKLVSWEDISDLQALILAVPHDFYLSTAVADFKSKMVKGAVLIDVKSVLDRKALQSNNIHFWRL